MSKLWDDDISLQAHECSKVSVIQTPFTVIDNIQSQTSKLQQKINAPFIIPNASNRLFSGVSVLISEK